MLSEAEGMLEKPFHSGVTIGSKQGSRDTHLLVFKSASLGEPGSVSPSLCGVENTKPKHPKNGYCHKVYSNQQVWLFTFSVVERVRPCPCVNTTLLSGWKKPQSHLGSESAGQD